MYVNNMAKRVRGKCTCGQLQYSLSIKEPDEARTSLCHCSSCRRAFGTNFGLTTKVPINSFKYESGQPKKYKQENGVVREFCQDCGTFICEYGEQAADKFRYVTWGTLDEPEMFPPKGEFFCSQRATWMPEVPGVFHKDELEE